jgi:hypothetical protein
MQDSDLTKLRRCRTQAYMRVRSLERLLEKARKHAEEADMALCKAAPESRLRVPRSRNPTLFRKNEVVWATLSILRVSQEPLGVREISRMALRAKGVLINQVSLEATVQSVRKVCINLRRKNLVQKIGEAKATRYLLHAHE